MSQYHYLDDSGDPGLKATAGSSTHLALAMVQMAGRQPLPELLGVRQYFHLPPSFEFKYQHTTPEQKAAFFEAIMPLRFRVRSVVVDKAALGKTFHALSGQGLIIEFACRLVLRASQLDIANDVLVIDGTTPLFRRALRLRLSAECHRLGRVRPFAKIISGDSRREDGLQLADMVVGAVRRHVTGLDSTHYRMFVSKVVDLWAAPGRG